MKIIEQSEIVTCVRYSLEFEWADRPGSGFSFECDKNGNVEPLNPCAVANYENCLAGNGIVALGVRCHEWSYYKPAIGKCNCGKMVCLDGFTNTCERCGSDYNSDGQLLAPREQWGEETGEALCDIIGGSL